MGNVGFSKANSSPPVVHNRANTNLFVESDQNQIKAMREKMYEFLKLIFEEFGAEITLPHTCTIDDGECVDLEIFLNKWIDVLLKNPVIATDRFVKKTVKIFPSVSKHPKMSALIDFKHFWGMESKAKFFSPERRRIYDHYLASLVSLSNRS